MTVSKDKRIAKAPFIIGDLLLLGMAGWIIMEVGGLPDGYKLFTVVGAIAVGMFFSTLPFLLEYRAELKREEISEFHSVAEQLQILIQLETHIRQATGQWQSIQDHCLSTVQNASQVSQEMTQESQRLAEVMKSMDVAEKEHLRVEAEKLRRNERDWIQAVVRMLDHVFALHKAAVQSAQPKLIQQITHFQHAVNDVMRRMGLLQHEAEMGASYNTELHQVLNDEDKQYSAPVVAETLAPGFTFQGRAVRPPLVRLVEKGDDLMKKNSGEADHVEAADEDPNVEELFDPSSDE
jgi:molecular chaperone GrpE (heat shock protein)